VAGVDDGVIDVIVSSHDPQSADTKRLPFAEAAFGAIGLETMLSAGLTLFHNENLRLERLVTALSQRPAQLLGLETSKLAPGAPADFTVVDVNKNWTVSEKSLFSKSKNTPFEHSTLEGRAIETTVAGRRVFAYAEK
jgi:dihydroorotase